jgi:hypothetical protein
MYPLYLAGAAVLGAGAYLFTRKKPIPPAVAAAAVQAPPPPAPAQQGPLTPNSPQAQAAAAAAQGLIIPASPEVQAAVALQQAATQFNPSPTSSPEFQAAVALQQAATQFNQSAGLAFPGTGINPSILQTGPDQGAIQAAAQAASQTLSTFNPTPVEQAQNLFDALNTFTDPNRE